MTNLFWSSDDWEFSPKKPFEKNLVSGWLHNVYKSNVQIIFCGLTGEEWSFDSVENPYLLFNSIELFSEKLKVLPSFHQRTAAKLLSESLERKFEPLPVEQTEPFAARSVAPFQWLRKPTKAELKSKKVFAFDKRMMYLSACSSLKFGEGKYEVVENIAYADFGKEWQGLCEVEFTWKQEKPFFAEFIKESCFLYTPYLSLISDFVDKLVIKKAWIFKDCKKTFEHFYKHLSRAIKETRIDDDKNKIVNSALKKIYTSFFGWLRSKSHAQGYAANLYRPDWNGLIVAQANVNLLRNILEVEKWTKGKLPFGIYHDCVMYFSNSKSDAEFLETPLFDANRFSREWELDAKEVFEMIEQGRNVGQIDARGKEAK